MNRNKIYQMTRRPSFLWKSALVLGIAIFILGSLISLLNDHPPSIAYRILELVAVDGEFDLSSMPDYGQRMTDAIHEVLVEDLSGDQPFYEKLEDVQYIVQMLPEHRGLAMPGPKELPGLSSNEYAVASAFGTMCLTSSEGRFPTSEQLESPKAGGPLDDLISRRIQYANFALALFLRHADPGTAEQALAREIELFNEDGMRERLVRLLLDEHAFDKLEALENEPGFESFIDSYALQRIALSRMDWPQLVRTLIPAAYEKKNPAMVALALVSGLVWTVILLRFSGNMSVRSTPVRLALPALLLGALSAHATILFIFWQEHQLNLGMGQDVLGQFVYCLGIGFREEGLKLLLFCPLIPFLWRKSDLEILTVAGLVGLGFAIEENINYFEGSAGLSALGRFATANFMHITLTAMGGLMLVRACVHRGRDIRHAVTTFASIIAFHGLYDAFLIVGVLADYAWLSFTIFILLCYQYFGWLRYLRVEWKDPVSITLVFTLGVVVVTGLSYGLFAWDVGIRDAFTAVMDEFLGIAVILIMFYREIPETLHV